MSSSILEFILSYFTFSPHFFPLNVNYTAKNTYFYRSQRSWDKVMFLHVFVILFTEGGLPHCMLEYPPPQTRTPPGSRHPPGQCMLGDTGNSRAVRILLECNLVLLNVNFAAKTIAFVDE